MIWLYVWLTFLSLKQGLLLINAQTICKSTVDIGFVIDSSGSLKDEFPKMLQFMNAFTEVVGVQKDGVHIGVVTFSYFAELTIQLDESEDTPSMKESIKKIPFMGSQTYINIGLQLAGDQLFNTSYGSRKDVPKVLILLTDGKQTQGPRADRPEKIAHDLRKDGIDIFAVGIGEKTSKDELIAIAGNPDKAYVVSSFDALITDAFISKITQSSCDSAERASAAPIGGGSFQDCNAPVDLMFLVDSSGSVTDQYWKEKEAIRRLTESFGIHAGSDSRAGLISYSNIAEMYFKLEDNQDPSSFYKALDALPIMGSTTRMDLALKVADDHFTGVTTHRSKFVFLLTDGQQSKTTDSFNPIKSASMLHKKGINLVVIGIGFGIDPFELLPLANDPQNFFLADDFDQFMSEGFLSPIQLMMCGIATKHQQKIAELKKKEPACDGIADIGFIVDSSGSLRKQYFKEKNFVKSLSRALQIGPSKSQVGVVLFSHNAELKIKLSDHNNIDSFDKAVDDLPLLGSTTRIDLALKVAYDEMFTESNGARRNVPKVLVLLTDGEQTQASDSVSPVLAAAPFHEADIKVIVIGIGSGVKPAQLEDVVKSRKDLYLAENFDELISDDFVRNITKSSCDKTVEASCKSQPLNIGFLVDSSGSLRNSYGKEKDFVKSLSSAFGLSRQGTRAGVVTFSYYAKMNIKMSDHDNVADFQDAVDQLPLMGSTTRIDTGLKLVGDEMFSPSNGAQPSSTNLLILLTDGSQTKGADAVDPGVVARELRERGIKMIVIGIGAGVNKTELSGLAGSEKSVYYATSFDELKSASFVGNVSARSCKEVEKVEETECNGLADIGFLVDSSGSLRNEYFKEKNFVKSLSRALKIGPGMSQVGVVLFSHNAELKIKLSDHNNIDSFDKAVDDLPLLGSTTRIDLALKVAYDEMFTESNGARRNVPKVLVLLTDGEQTQASDSVSPVLAAAPFHEADIKVIVIGIGSGVKPAQLEDVVKSRKDLYLAENFDELISDDFVRNITKSSCDKTVEASCKSQPLNIGFLVDSSGSLRNSYGKEKDFVKSLSSAFGLSRQGTRAGVVTFSYYAKMNIKMSDHDNVADFQDAVDQLPLMGSTTRIDTGLKLVGDEMFSPSNGAQPSSTNLLILLTDGSQTKGADAVDPGVVARELRERGIKMIVIGIGAGVNKTELSGLAGSEKSVYYATSFDELKSASFVGNVSARSCKEVEKVEETECNGLADIGFLVDSSGSLRNEYFKEKNFVKSLSRALKIGPGMSQVGVVLFSHNAELKIKLSDHNNIDSFDKAVDDLPLLGSTTRIDLALKVAYDEMFTESNGARRNVPKVLVLLTDGEQTQASDSVSPVLAATPFHEADIKVIVIGIGSGVKPAQLEDVVKSRKDLYLAENFDELISDDFVRNITKSSCDKTVEASCKSQPLNIGFLVDSSGSLRNSYGKEKDFVKSLSSAFGLSRQGTRAGVVTFSYYAKMNIKMSDHDNVADFQDAVDQLPLMGSTTRIDTGLKLVGDEMFSPSNGAQPSSTNLLILLTDGSQTKGADAVDPGVVARELRERGIKMIVIGIGAGVNKTELSGLAGSEKSVYYATSFDELKSASFVGNVSARSCKEVEKVEETECNGLADIGFLVDSSGSLRNEYFKEKNFVKSLSRALKIGPGMSQVGVVLFSHNAELKIKLSDHNNIDSFNKAVDDLPLLGSTTRIDLALKVAYDEMFTESNGARRNVPKVLVLLTDGEQTQASDSVSPVLAAAPFHEADIKVIVIGIGSGVKPAQLEDVVKSRKDLYLAENFDELISDDFVRNITKSSCDKTVEASCKSQPLNIGFLVDSSGSLRNSYGKEKDFVKSLSSAFGLSRQGTRAGVVTFSYYAKMNIKMSDHDNVADFQDAVDQLPLMGSTTRIDTGLKLVGDEMFSPSNGAQPSSTNLLILLTDGSQTKGADAVDPGVVARELRERGIKMIVIGIGAGVNKTELSGLAGSEKSVYYATSFDELKSASFVGNVSARSCKEVEKVEETECNGLADIGFLVDSSGSLRNEYFKEKNFVKSLSRALKIGPGMSQVGVVLFSHNAELKIKLSDHNNIDSFDKAVDDLPLLGSTTRIDLALKVAYDEMFTESNGARRNVPKVLVLLTDGEQTQASDSVSPVLAAAPFHEADIKVIVIGIGSGVKPAQLEDVVKSRKDLYLAVNFDELISDDFVRNITKSSCDKTVEASCKSQPLNIGFLVDSSGSLRNSYGKEKDFVKSLSSAFGLSRQGTRAGVVTFSYYAKMNIKMSDHDNVADFQDAVDQLPLMGSTTRIDTGLKLVGDEMFSPSNGAQPSSTNLLILLTDGSQTKGADAVDPGVVARELRERGIKMIVIGIGAGVNKTELSGLAGSEKSVYYATSFDELKSASFVGNVSARSCKEVEKVEETECNGLADIGFLVDSSGSLRNEYFKEKNFVKSLSRALKIGPGMSQVGVVLFSHNAELKIKLSDHNNIDLFDKAVDDLPLLGSTTRIDLALKVAYDEMFTESNGARRNVPKVLVLLTDGEQTQASDSVSPVLAAAPFHEADIKVIVIGIGSGVKPAQLEDVVKSRKDLYLAENFDELISDDFVRNITKSSCDKTVEASCKSQPLNIGFLVDSSGSLRNSYGKEKDFVKSLSSAFGLSRQGTRAGVVTFSYYAKMNIKMSDHDNVADFQDAVDQLPLMGSTTRIDTGLKLVGDEMFSPSNGAQPSSTNLLILLTDGSQTKGADAVDPGVVARELRERGIKMIVIGIGAGVNKTELSGLAGSEKSVYYATSFDELKSASFVGNVSARSCKEVEKVEETECNGLADIGFLVDSSGSLRNEYFKEKNFVKSLSRALKIGPGMSQVGVVLFSHNAELKIKLSDHNNIDSFDKAVDDLPLLGSTTRIDLALKVAYDEMFTESNGARRNVPKVLVLLTDGEQTQASDSVSPVLAAAPFHEADIKVIVIGIGSGVKPAQLEDVVKSRKDLYLAENFDELISDDFVRNITKSSCDKTVEASCKSQPLNIGFLVDSSGSLRNSYGKEKDFVKSLSSAFGLSRQGTRAGVVTFSYYAKMNIKMSDHDNVADFQDAVDQLPLMGSTTRIDTGLKLVGDEMFSPSNGAQPSSTNLLILLTDGSQTKGADAVDPGVVARELRERGIKMIVIGIGAGVNKTELSGLAGSEKSVYYATSFDELKSASFVGNVSARSCKEVEKVEETECNGLADIGFLVDSSGSLRNEYFKEKNFVKSLSRALKIGPGMSQVGVVLFSHNAELKIKLSDHNNIDSFDKAVDDLPLLGSTTRIDLALKVAYDEMFTESNGARRNVPKVLVLLTDGEQTQASDSVSPVLAAAPFHEADIKVIVIGIGSGVKPAQLEDVVKSRKDLYLAENFDELISDDFVRNITKSSCDKTVEASCKSQPLNIGFLVDSSGSLRNSYGKEKDFVKSLSSAFGLSRQGTRAGVVTFSYYAKMNIKMSDHDNVADFQDAVDQLPLMGSTTRIDTGLKLVGDEMFSPSNGAQPSSTNLLILLTDGSQTKGADAVDPGVVARELRERGIKMIVIGIGAGVNKTELSGLAGSEKSVYYATSFDELKSASFVGNVSARSCKEVEKVEETECNGLADIGFLVDSSGSLRNEYFKEKNFVKSLSRALKIGPGMSQVGVVLFSHNAELKIKLSDHNNIDSFDKAVDDLPLLGSTTRIDLALKVAYDEMFTESNGARRNVPKVLVLLTDGEQTQASDSVSPVLAAAPFHEADIKVIVIGIGSGVKPAQLEDVVKSRKDLYLAENFDELISDDFVRNITKSSCDKTVEASCKSQPLNIGFLVDSSGSLRNSYGKEKDFVKSLSSAFGLSRQGTRAGVVTFSYYAKMNIKMSDHDNVADFQDAVDQLPLMGSTTRIDTGLKLVGDEMFSPSNGAQPSSTNLLILLTDGSQTKGADAVDPGVVARELRERGIKMIVIGIGAGVNKTELSGLAGSEKSVYYATSFDELKSASFVGNVSARSCKEVEKVEETECNGLADIGFLVDSSGSLRNEYFKEKNFVKSLSRALKIGPGMSQVGVVLFSHNAELKIKLSDHNNIDSFDKAVDDLPLLGSTTRIDLALKVAYDEMFTESNGARRNVPKVLVLLTDGEQTQASDSVSPVLAAAPFHEADIKVIVIGIGSGVKPAQLEDVVKSRKDLYLAENFDELISDDFVRNITKSSCDKTVEASCKSQPLNIGFLVDSSGSLRNSYGKEKDFVKSLSSAFGLSRQGTRAGVVTFSYYAKMNIKMSDHDNVADFQDAVDQLPLMGSTTRIDTGLKLVGDEMFSPSNGAQPSSTNLLILLTDGSQTKGADAVDPGVVARELRERGIKMIVIGIGAGVNKTELSGLAGSEKSVYYATSFDELKSASFVGNVSARSCKEVEKVEETECNGLADIGFLVDSSGSLRNEYFKEKNFVKSLSRALKIGPGMSQVGVVLFSHNAELKIKLSDHNNIDSFDKAVDDLPLLGSTTRIDLALKVAYDEMFTESNGARRNVPKVLVLLTDGEQTQASDSVSPVLAAAPFHEADIKVIVIGIGSGVKPAQLEDVVKSRKDLYLAENFDELISDDFVRNITKSSCDKTVEASCKSQPLNIGFLVDSSGSLRNSYGKEKDFVKSLSSAFGLSRQGTRAGVVTFSYYAKMNIKMSDHDNVADFQDAVDQLPLMGSTTRIDTGLKLVGDEMFSPSNGAQPSSTNLLILLTDGSQTKGADAVDPGVVARELRERGIKMIVIGIGAGVNKTELSGLAGSEKSVYYATSFDELKSASFVGNVSARSCKEVEKVEETECNGLADIGFLVDSSGSLRNEYFKEKNFVKSLSRALKIGPGMSQVGVVLFSHNAELKIKLSDHNNIDSFDKAVDDLPLLGSTTRIDLALKVAYDEMFTESNGARRNVPKVLVLLTDGEQTQASDSVSPVLAAAPFHEADIKVIVIGIGSGVKPAQLEDVVKSRKDLYLAENFDELISDDFVRNITKSSCDKTVEASCKSQPLNIGFLVDSSGSLRNSYGKEKDFVKSLSSAFGLSRQGTRAGVVTFSYYAKMNIKMSDHDNVADFQDAVDQLPLMGSTTRIDTGLKLVGDEMFSPSNGAQPSSTNLLILLTDGSQTKGAEAVDPGVVARELRERGIKMIVIGIGAGVNKTELSGLAGSEKSVYYATSFDELKSASFVGNVSARSCKEVEKVEETECNGLADIGFLVDSSGSLRNEYFKEKNFVKSLSRALKIGPGMSQVGVVLFSHNAELKIKLSDHNNIDSFDKAVDDLPLLGSTTRIDLALKVAYDEMFTESNGARRNVPKVLVLLTDGEQTQASDSVSPVLAAAPFHEADIKVIVIGIGSGVKPAQLEDVVKSRKDLYLAENFDELISDDFVRNITKSSCDKTVEASCKSQPLNIGFLVDSSGSLRNSYGKEKDFVKSLSSAFGLSRQGTRAGVVTFSYYAKMNIKMSDHDNVADFQDAVDQLPLMGSTTRIDTGLKLVGDEMFSPSNGAQPSSTNLLILLTDGSQTKGADAVDPGVVARELRERGIKMIVIGIGAGVNKTELSGLAGSEKSVYYATSFDELKSASFVGNVSARSCKEVEKVEETECNGLADIGFLVDSSGSLRNEYFKEKNFVKSLSRALKIGPGMSQVGVVLFSHNAELKIKLSDHNNIDSFDKAVDDLPLLGSTTRIDLALKVAYDEMFTESNGARRNVPKVLVLLTDGEQTQASDSVSPVLAAAPFHEADIKVIVIGIGSGVKPAQLEDVVKSRKDLYLAENFDELISDDFVRNITKSSCDKTVEASCKSQPLNIGFLVDSSGSLRNSYGKEKDFVKSLSSSFGLSRQGTRAGVVTFSYYAKMNIKMSDHDNVADFQDAVDQLPLMGSTTRIDTGLKLVGDEMFSPSNGAQPSSTNLLILLTDGSQTKGADAVDPGVVARKLRERGIKMIVVGIGAGVNKTELNGLAGSEKNVYYASSFDVLKSESFVGNVSARSCKEVSSNSTYPSDILYLLDSSSKIPSDVFKQYKFIISQIINTRRYRNRDDHVGLMEYSSTSVLLHRLSVLPINNIAYDRRGGIPNLKEALVSAYKTLYSYVGGSRRGVPKTLILFTSSSDEEILRHHDSFKPFIESGTRIIIIQIKSPTIPLDGKPWKGMVSKLKPDLNLDVNLGNNTNDKIDNYYDRPCTVPLDTAFVIGASAQSPSKFILTKLMIRSIVSKLSKKSSFNSAFLTLVNSQPRIDATSDQSYDAISFIDNMIKLSPRQQQSSVSSLLESILYAKYNLLYPNAMARRNTNSARVVFVVLDDSQSLDSQTIALSSIAKDLEQDNIRLVLLISGKSHDMRVVNSLVVSPFDIFRHDSNIDDQTVQKIIMATCSLIGRPIIPVEYPNVCEKPMYVGIIMDSSSTSTKHFITQKVLIQKIADSIRLSRQHSCISVMAHSSLNTYKLFRYEDGCSASNIRSGIDAIQMTTKTNTLEEKLTMITEMNSPRYGITRDIPKLIIVLIEANDTRSDSVLENYAREAKKKGLTVVFVQMDNEKSYSGFQDIASPYRSVYKTRGYYHRLPELAKTIVRRNCLSPPTMQTCQLRADIVFAIDISPGSDLKQQQMLAKDLARRLDLFNQSRVGLISYNSRSSSLMTFSNQQTNGVFNMLLESLRPALPGRRFNEALREAYVTFFDVALTNEIINNEQRQKVLILLASGPQSGNTNAMSIADTVRPLQDVATFILTVQFNNTNTYQDEEDLIKIATTRQSAILKSKNETISDVSKRIANEICYNSKQAPSSLNNCQLPFDIVFVVDSSASLINDYAKQITLVESLVNRFNLSPSGSRAAVVIYSNTAHVGVDFTTGQDISTFKQAMRKLPFIGRNTRLDVALLLSRSLLTKRQYGSRDYARKLVIVLTDGEQNEVLGATKPETIAQTMLSRGTMILPIGVGGAVNDKELRSISSKGFPAFRLQTFDDPLVDSVIDMIVQSACSRPGPSIVDNGNLAGLLNNQCIDDGNNPSIIGLDRDIRILESLLNSGMRPNAIVNTLDNTGTLESLFKYEREINKLLTRFAGPPSSSTREQYAMNYLTGEKSSAPSLGSCFSDQVTTIIRKISDGEEYNKGKDSILHAAVKQNLTIFVDLLRATGLDQQLTDGSPYSLFAPSDNAFLSLTRNQLKQLEDVCYLKRALRLHLSSGKRLMSNMNNADTIPTLNGKKRLYVGAVGKVKTIDGIAMDTVDHVTLNGVVHTLNGVLFPSDGIDLIDFIKSKPQLSKLVQLIQCAGVEKFISAMKPVTLFAPDDAAFDKLSKSKQISIENNAVECLNIIQNHIYIGLFHTGLIDIKERYTITSLNGKQLDVYKQATGVISINDKSQISNIDLKTTDGMLHIIDKVLE